VIAQLPTREPLREHFLTIILQRVQRVCFFEEGIFLDLSLSIRICGALHGQFSDWLLFDPSGDASHFRYFLSERIDWKLLSIETIPLFFGVETKTAQFVFFI
jgi:hypothetical protein